MPDYVYVLIKGAYTEML